MKLESLARLNGFNGISIFSWDSHKNNVDWLSKLTEVGTKRILIDKVPGVVEVIAT